MAEIAASGAAATKCTDILVDKAVKELRYLCCYKSYAVDFEGKKAELSAAVESVGVKIREAKTRNETQINPIVNHWVENAENLIQQQTTPKKWFGFCTDWFSQCSRAKELERMMQEIPTMMEKAENFSRVAHAAERPGMEFYSQEFIHFESRNSILEQLREELKDDNKWRIGLQAMGGSGKTTMAKAVGKELENSKAFDKVIFIEVPNPVDEKKIQDEIEKKLELKLEDDQKRNLTLVEQIWIRIANAGNVLIILDDVWEELNLENIGIHHGINTQGRCCVLLTTRYETICTRMGCQKIIKLGVLPEEDAVDLFLHYASETGKDCPNKLKFFASKIVNECGNLPVIVVAVARTFRNWDPNEWEDAFTATEKDASMRHGNIDVESKKFYNSLKVSFECLDRGAQDIMLLCSIFPRAYEIPVELLSIIAIGLGLCGNVDRNYRARSQVLSIKTKLVSSALLLTTSKGCVKMHDVIRDVAQQIGGEKIQLIMNSKTKLKENVKFSSWMIDDFSNCIENDNLEVLLVWVNANTSLEVPGTFFRGMKGLRVLLLCSEVKFRRTFSLSLSESIHSLENIQTLSLTSWKLGDISILKNLKQLQALELTNCSFIELPNNFSQLERLKLLGLVRCSFERNNPFEVIGKCSKLDVLYYVSNNDTLDINAQLAKVALPQEFGIYHIEGSHTWRSFQLDASTKRYFNSTKLKGILSESTMKSLAARAEILELIECNETRWTNLIPDMIHPMKDGGMNDLIRLSLKSWPAIQCLINTNGVQSDAIVFSNLVELQLHDMLVRELCHGDFPQDFLKQLEKLYLSSCVEIDGTLFKCKLKLSNLKSVELYDCSMTCLFHLSIAQSLKQLESFHISGCSKLKILISDDDISAKQKADDHQDPNLKKHDSMFPKLKFLEVRECHKLEFILPFFPCKELESVIVDGCNELKYIFGQCLEEGELYQTKEEMILPLLQQIEIANVPKFINIYPECYFPQPSQVQNSWVPLCCFSKANHLDRNQALKEKRLSRSGGLFAPPLYPYKNLRKMSVEGISESKSLLTLSIASSLKLLEELTIKKCGELEHIVTDEGHHVFNHMNDCFIFSNLKQFSIFDAEKLKYLFGKYHSNQKHSVHLELNLPHLESLRLHNVPNMVGICTQNYSVKAPSLQDMSLQNCPQHLIDVVMNIAVDDKRNREEDLSKREEKGRKEFTCLHISKPPKKNFVRSTGHGYCLPPLCQFNLKNIEINGSSQLTSLFTISIASSLKLLETLKVLDCDTLEHIIKDEGPNNSYDHYMNVHSIFPNLQTVLVWRCNNLEYVFPTFYSKELKDLKSVTIRKAKKMKYVFGKGLADQILNGQGKISLPALKYLYLHDVPSMVSICAENDYVEVLYLQHIRFEGCQQLPKKFIDFLVGGRHKRQEDLSRRKGKTPSNFLSFRSLSSLRFVGCKQLKFILSASTTRSMPVLRDLFISHCEELVNIVKDDEGNQQNPLDPQDQSCFQMLCVIQVKHCKKLKCLFSISTCAKFPRLFMLEIEDAPELAQVFERKQGAPQGLVIKDVLPNLLAIRLVNLPSLHTIHQGIDFQSVKFRLVRACNNILSNNGTSDELFEYVMVSLPQEKINFVDNNDYHNMQHTICQWACERRSEESQEALERDKTISEQNSSVPDLVHSQDASKEGVGKASTIQKQKSCSPNLTKIEEEGLSQEDIGNDSRMLQKSNVSPNLENNIETSASEIVEEQLSSSNTAAIPSSKFERDNLDRKARSSTHSQIKISNLGTSTSTKESKGDQEAFGEVTSLKQPTNDLFTKETSKKAALTIPPSTITATEKTSLLSQIATSATHTKLKSSQLDPLDISITTECPQDNLVHKEVKSERTHIESTSSMNLKATSAEDHSLEKYDQASSSTYTRPKIEKPYPLALSKELRGKESIGDDRQELGGSTRSANEAPQRVEEPTNECSSKETSNEMALTIPPSVTGMPSLLVSSICSPKKPQIAVSATQVEMESESSAINDHSPQGQIIGNQRETSIEDDLIRLFRIMRDGSDLDVGLPSISKAAAFKDDKVAKAFADIESSLKIDLHHIANSEEHTCRLENALNFLSTRVSEEEPSSHGHVRGKIDSLRREIQRILSSFNQASDNLDTLTKLEHKEKWIDEQHSEKMEAAITLVSEIRNTEDYMIKLKEEISSLQAELKSKEKEFEDCETKLSCLEKQKKECVLDTIGFMEEYETVKKDKSYVVDDQTKARQELKRVENQWPSCVADLRKIALLLEILLKQKP